MVSFSVGLGSDGAVEDHHTLTGGKLDFDFGMIGAVFINPGQLPDRGFRSGLCHGKILIAGGAGHSKLCPVTGAAGGAYCPARELGPLLGGDLRRLVPPPCTVRRLSAGMFGRVLVLFCADIHITSAILSAFYSNVKEKNPGEAFFASPGSFSAFI